MRKTYEKPALVAVGALTTDTGLYTTGPSDIKDSGASG